MGRWRRPLCLAALMAALGLLGGLMGLLHTPASPAGAYPIQGSYKGAPLRNCPDPAITKVDQEGGLTHWYMFCTANPLNDNDTNADGSYHDHLIAILHSTDLLTWDHVGDVFAAKPKWVARDAG